MIDNCDLAVWILTPVLQNLHRDLNDGYLCRVESRSCLSVYGL